MEEIKKEYLAQLIHHLQEAKHSHSAIPFIIERQKQKGFLIKVGGLWGFIPFERMPWYYKNRDTWKYVAPFLVGHRFFCFIYDIQTDPVLQITVDGKAHIFNSKKLREATPYKAIVIKKTSYGLFLEVGYHYNWRYGSIVGLTHKSTFEDITKYENAKQGDIITTYFYDYTTDNKLILGDSEKVADFSTRELQNLIGTIKEVIVKKTPSTRFEYLVEGKYPAVLSLTKTIYPKEIKKVKIVTSKFQDNEKIICHIIGIKLNKKLQIKLADQHYKI